MTKHETITAVTLGIFSGIPNADYHGGPGISKSGLDMIRRSPLHYKASLEAEKKEPTAAMREGTMVHDLVLEPGTFWERYVRPFDPAQAQGAIATTDEIKDRLRAHGLKVSGTKAELKARLLEVEPASIFLDDVKAEYAAAADGKTVLTAEELARAQAMAEAVKAHPIAGKLLAPDAGTAELSCYWTDPKTGVLCRCRPDFWRHDDIVVDVKTTVDASPEGFSKSIDSWGYHRQDAFYQDGIRAAIQQSGSDRNPPKAFVFVVVEKSPPHAVAVYRLDSDSAEIGRREYREALDTYAACQGLGEWPGYGDKIQSIGLPAWRLNIVEE